MKLLEVHAIISKIKLHALPRFTILEGFSYILESISGNTTNGGYYLSASSNWRRYNDEPCISQIPT